MSSSIALILPDDTGLDACRRSLNAAAVGIQVVSGNQPLEVLSKCGEGLVFVLVHVSLLTATLTAVGRQRRIKIAVFTSTISRPLLEISLQYPAIVGLLAWGQEGARNWEVMYLARRVLASEEDAPHMGALLSWGSTTVAFRPKDTQEQRSVVRRIELMCKRLGVQRQVAAVVSAAAHELLMNAMYDAPVDRRGRAKYAMDRAAMITLLPEEVPTLRFTVDGPWLALDITDPFGRLPRNRFFEGVLRGQQALHGEGGAVIDTSHGGAGLGLHTLFTSGSILRVELAPAQRTHVSWALDRTWSRRQRRNASRSLYFVPNPRKRK